MSTNPSSHNTGSPNAAEESTLENQASNPPSSNVHFSADISGIQERTKNIILVPDNWDFAMHISQACAKYNAIRNEATFIRQSRSIDQRIRLSFDTAPETFGTLNVIRRGSREYEEDEGAPSRSRVARQEAEASGQVTAALRQLTVLNGETVPSRPSQGSGQERSEGGA